MKKSSSFLNFISVLLLVGAIAGMVFYVNPMRSNLDSLEEDLVEKEAEVADLTSRVVELEALRDELGSSGVSEAKLLLQVPEGAEQDELVTGLAELSEEAGIDLHGMSFSNIEGDTNGVVTIAASFDGDYEDLVSFLESVESSSRKIKVKSIAVQLSEEGGVAHASFSLLMEAYYQ